MLSFKDETCLSFVYKLFAPFIFRFLNSFTLSESSSFAIKYGFSSGYHQLNFGNQDFSIPKWMPSENDPIILLFGHGYSKWEGEERLHKVNPAAIVIRTAWLYSAYGNNFVKTMLRLGSERDNLGVVFDQIGTPTYAADLATAIYTIIETPQWKPGTYHFTNEGVCSWYDFTIEILRQAKEKTGKEQWAKVRPILSSEYQYKTPRPHYSVLDKGKIKQTFDMEIPYWTDGLHRCLCEIL